MKTKPETIRHLIGNPLFAIETNLFAIKQRTDSYTNLSQVPDIIKDMQTSIEKIKVVLHKLD